MLAEADARSTLSSMKRAEDQGTQSALDHESNATMRFVTRSIVAEISCAQQPGKPKPPGNPRRLPDRDQPPPVEEPPEPTPPPEREDPPPMQA
jgi:hypothetical protein